MNFQKDLYNVCDINAKFNDFTYKVIGFSPALILFVVLLFSIENDPLGPVSALSISILSLFITFYIASKLWNKDKTYSYMKNNSLDLNLKDRVLYMNGFKFKEGCEEYIIEDYKEEVVLLKDNTGKYKEVELTRLVADYRKA